MTYRSMMDHFFSSQRPLFSLSNRVWNPPTDIYETDTNTVIRMEVAGLDEDELQVIAQRNVLTVRGRRVQALPDDRVKYHLMEVHYGEFERSFGFPYPLDTTDIKAAYEKGFIVIEVPRRGSAATQVQIQVIEDIPER